MEDFGYQKDESQNKFSGLAKSAFLTCATLFSITCFVYVTINSYYFIHQDKNSDIEIIKAEEGPIKILEEEKNSGENSLQINSSIYEDIFGNKGGKKENLKQVNPKIRSAPEPVLPPKITDKKEVRSASNPEKIIVFSNDNKKEAPSKDLLTKTDGEERAITNKPAVKLDEKNKKRAVRVQVAAMSSKTAAEDHWSKLNRLYPNLFSGLKSYSEEVNLGKRGIFYRLQVGNFFNQIEAEQFCEKYVVQTQKSKADCILVE
jgi:hypothetical protein